VRVSILLSIFNRSELLDLGLRSLLRQTMPAKEWEVILLDDMSTDDLSKVYKRYPINVTHVRFNPKDHPNYKGYHTQSLALNLGARKAKGEVLCVSQPEMLHDKENLARGYSRALQDDLVYGLTILSHRKFSDWLRASTSEHGFGHLWDEANKLASPFHDNEYYWYIAFVKRQHFVTIHGVEETYMEGVYAEDDEWKERLGFAGVNSCLDKSIRGIHVNHEFEADLYPKQDRVAGFWKKGAEHNRARYFQWQKDAKAEGQNPKDWMIANKHLDTWGDPKYIVAVKEQHV